MLHVWQKRRYTNALTNPLQNTKCDLTGSGIYYPQKCNASEIESIGNLKLIDCDKSCGVVKLTKMTKGLTGTWLSDTFQNFLISEHIKPCMHVLEISISLLNHVFVRPTKTPKLAGTKCTQFYILRCFKNWSCPESALVTSKFSWDSQLGRLRTTSMLVRAFWNFKLMSSNTPETVAFTIHYFQTGWNP